MPVIVKPNISNGIIINGVANFWQTTPPITRVDGSALVDGDIWYKADTQETWFRKGIYWVSDVRSVFSNVGSSGTYLTVNAASVSLNWRPAPITKPILIEQITFLLFPVSGATSAATYNSSNFYTISAATVNWLSDSPSNNSTPLGFAGFVINSWDALNEYHKRLTFQPNLVLWSQSINYLATLTFTRTGSPQGFFLLSIEVRYRNVYG